MGYTRKALATRGRILDSAADLMFTKGFTRTKLMEVLNAANIQKGNFYYYFASKEELGLAVIRERGERLVKRWQEELINPGNDPWSNLSGTANEICSNPEDMENNNPVSNLVLDLYESSEEFRSALGVIVGENVNVLASEFKRLKESGRLKSDSDPQQLGAYMFSLLHGALFHYRATGDEAMLKSNIENGMKCLEAHLK